MISLWNPQKKSWSKSPRLVLLASERSAGKSMATAYGEKQVPAWAATAFYYGDTMGIFVFVGQHGM